jgi:hypothetical protein
MLIFCLLLENTNFKDFSKNCVKNSVPTISLCHLSIFPLEPNHTTTTKAWSFTTMPESIFEFITVIFSTSFITVYHCSYDGQCKAFILTPVV